MKITQIRVENFRQYRHVEIDLSSPQSDFVVIQGKNGAGKTNLLRALKWGIYGDLDMLPNNPGQPLLSNSVFSEMKNGDAKDTKVVIELSREDGLDAVITRTQTFKKSGTNLIEHGDSELKIQIKRDALHGYVVEPDPKAWIEKELPKRFRPYFLFDGEQLNKFLQDSDAPKIRSAIQEVARIDVLNRIQEQLGSASIQLNQKAARLVGVDGEKLATQLGEIEVKIEKKLIEIDESQDRFKLARETEEELDALLRGQKDVEANINRKKQVEGSLARESASLVKSIAEFNAKMKSISPVALMAPALRKLGEIVNDARDKNILPPPINLAYLREILERGKCICGLEFASSPEHTIHLEKVISDYVQVGEVGEALNEHATIYSPQLAKLNPQAEVVALLNQRIDDGEKLIKGFNVELNELATELEGQDDERVRDLAIARRSQSDVAYRARRSAEIAEGDLQVLRQLKSDVEKSIQKATSTNTDSLEAHKNAQFAQISAGVAKTLYETMNLRVREAVSSSLESRFKAMIWKKDTFDKVSIDNNFRVSVLNRNGLDLFASLSSGETACLAFAFSLTLSNEAGLNFPMVVDTPMGRLGRDVQENLAEVLVDATKGNNSGPNHQIILLMTDTEYTDRVASVFAKRHPRLLQINFDTNTEEAKVV